MCSSSILFAGDSDIGQLIKIFEVLGTPGARKAVPWSGVEELPYYNADFPTMRPKDLRQWAGTRELCKSPHAEDLLRRMLRYNPSERITAAEALNHPFLRPDAPPPGCRLRRRCRTAPRRPRPPQALATPPMVPASPHPAAADAEDRGAGGGGRRRRQGGAGGEGGMRLPARATAQHGGSSGGGGGDGVLGGAAAATPVPRHGTAAAAADAALRRRRRRAPAAAARRCGTCGSRSRSRTRGRRAATAARAAPPAPGPGATP